ncbi:MAG: AAA family ATPase [bacterium]|nr:AAA family ATPase [bacterium]
MFLAGLTLKGFKSFADTTTIQLAPGLSVVVGPNGSGKSNIVDAISWVLGSQSPSALRSAQMDDVIFAGNPGRAALGRAEVTLTFDNADRRLPLDLDEVAISRTLFRSGDSAYAINGIGCRLIDISEMLSSAGVGRHRHVIVSQGHIDAVLQAKPAERRAILEEAAGVSAYRLRKEKALRRLEDTDANLARLGDQLDEVRRALRPLERQASLARRHGALAAELAALQIHRLGTELVELRERRRRAATERRDLADRRAAATRRLAALDGRIAQVETRLSAPGHVALAAASERLASLEELLQQAQRAIGRRQQDYDRRRRGALAGDLLASLAEEAARLEADLGDLGAAETELVAERRRLDAATTALTAEAQAQAGCSESSGAALAAAEQCRAEAAAAEAAAAGARAAASSEHDRWAARLEALALAFSEARARSGMEVLCGRAGVLGALGDLVTVEEGWEAAFEAAAADALAAAVTDSPASARAALEALVRAEASGSVLAAGAPDGGPPPVGEPLRPRIRGKAPAVEAVLDSLIGAVAVAPSWREACDAAAVHPGLTVVTAAGDCFSPTGWRVALGAPDRAGAALAESRQRLESAERSLAEADRVLVAATAATAAADGRLAEVQQSVEAAEAAAREAAAELQRRRSDLDAERRSLDRRASEVGARRAVTSERLGEIRTRLGGHEAAVATADDDARRSTVLAELAERLAASAGECRRGLERLRARQRQLAEAGRVAAAQLEGDRRQRAELSAAVADAGEQLLAAQRAEDELRLRIESVVETLADRHDCDEIRASGAERPKLPDGVTAPERIRELERLLRGIGPVNPLAAEEHDNLRRRHDELASQIEDVRSARRDLTKLVRSVDGEILEAFTRCYREVAESFESVFGVLFDGGAGRLSLTDPHDPLSSGVEIEAQPAGKSLRRLALLSGGERSLAALAFLFAVFRSQGSPFYVLDEVDAALDDLNLHRFLRLIEEFRTGAQLILVTHQKPTMEIADSLYGVTMRPGGASLVISERRSFAETPQAADTGAMPGG